MKILVINGSPKGTKSNTWQLTQAFLDGLGETDFSVIDIAKSNISSCLGCFYCWKKESGKCVIKDDMSHHLQQLLEADLIIWSFPLYYYGVPGALKTFIDRQLPLSLPFMNKEAKNGGHPSRYDRSHQKHILISTCGFHTTKGNYDSVLAMFNHFLPSYETIFCSQGELFQVSQLKDKTEAYLALVKNAGQEYRNGAISNETHNQLCQPLYPKDVFEAMADASWGIDKQTGQKDKESYIFTKQMAALYNPLSYQEEDIVLEICYTDLNETYQIHLGKEKAIVIKSNFTNYTTRIETPYSLWLDIAAGNVRGDEALMKQQYRVLGDLDILINWGKYFGSSDVKEESPTKKKSTNMLNLLLPWILFWIVVSFENPIYLFVVVSIILFYSLISSSTLTIYDELSKCLVTILCMMKFLNISSNTLLALSYLCFGLMWLLSCLKKTPLTAHYSMNDYGGKKILDNPIFIKTNQILTLLWGGLYCVSSIITLLSQIYSNLHFISLLNYFLPLVLGVFTIWFQKWYPKHIMSGKQ